MLDKKVILGVAKDKDGVIIVDKESKKGVRIPDEAVAQLTLIVWDLCDKTDEAGIVAKLIGEAQVSGEQKAMLDQFVGESLGFFQKMGWAATHGAGAKKVVAVKKGPAPKKAVVVKKPAPAAKKK